MNNFQYTPDQLITMILAGATVLNLFFLLIALILNKLFKVRICFSSLISSITLSWFTIGAIGVIIGEPVSGEFVGGLALLGTCLIYSAYLVLMQPDTVQILAKKELRKQELRRRELEELKLKSDIKRLKKSNDGELSKRQQIEEANLRLAQIEMERAMIKQSYRIKNPLNRFFKKKVQKVINKQ